MLLFLGGGGGSLKSNYLLQYIPAFSIVIVFMLLHNLLQYTQIHSILSVGMCIFFIKTSQLSKKGQPAVYPGSRL